jgi:hypothetical protein
MIQTPLFLSRPALLRLDLIEMTPQTLLWQQPKPRAHAVNPVPIRFTVMPSAPVKTCPAEEPSCDFWYGFVASFVSRGSPSGSPMEPPWRHGEPRAAKQR